jgi:2-polyprenyl-3-methyl-5-hydroxy-6-metoxy-1,4-benzoquinol methylase
MKNGASMHHGGTGDLAQQAEREARFFDEVYTKAEKRFSGKKFEVPEELIRQIVSPRGPFLVDREYASSLIGGLAGKNVLDYGCGDGWNAVCLAKAGARVWAIDISEAGVELTKKMAASNGVAESIHAEVQDCYQTRFESDTFDVIYGSGIIHHLDIGSAASELKRILRPDGIAVFCEPIRESSITDRVKRLVLFVSRIRPQNLTEDEEVLTLDRIAMLRGSFRVVNCKQFIVLSTLTAVIPSRRLRRLLLWADYLLMRVVPGFRRMGRSVVIELRQPIKPQLE